ncbi:hypothetical protein ACJX0J_040013, partial [Zea mays]
MRVAYSAVAHFLLQWTDCKLAAALGLLKVMLYKVCADGSSALPDWDMEASIREFYGVIFPSLLQLPSGITELDDRKERKLCLKKFRSRDEQLSEVDTERELECGICLEVSPKVVLPNCAHMLCMRCFEDCYVFQLCTFMSIKFYNLVVAKYEMAPTLLRSLKPQDMSVTIQVQVSRKWEFHGNTDIGSILHIDMILADKECQMVCLYISIHFTAALFEVRGQVEAKMSKEDVLKVQISEADYVHISYHDFYSAFLFSTSWTLPASAVSSATSTANSGA